MKKYYGNKDGARNFARKFYSSKSWRTKSSAYRIEHPLCERCLKHGIYTKSTCVHHKEHISRMNQYDWNILLGDDNLEALCDDCHAKEHAKYTSYEFDEDGTLIDNYDDGND